MSIKKTTINLVFIIIVIVSSALVLWDFSFQLQNTLKKETYRTLDEVSQHYNKTFVDRINHNTITLKVLSDALEAKQNWLPEELSTLLQNAVDDGGYTKLVVSGKDGISYSNCKEVVDINNRDYFVKAMNGESNVTQPMDSLTTGEKTIIISVPIFKDGLSNGILFGVYPISTAGTLLLDSTYYSDGYGFVISPDGSIIFSSKHEDRLSKENNLFHFFSKTEIIDSSIKDLKDIIKNKESKNFEFNYKGEKRFVSLMPSTVNDWYTFSITSDTLMLKQEKATNRVVMVLIIKLILLTIVVSAWIAYHNLKRRKEVIVANNKYQSLLDNINGGVIVTKHSSKADEIIVNYISNGFSNMTGYTLEDINSLYHGRFVDMMFVEDFNQAFEDYLEQSKDHNNYHISYRIHGKNKEAIWVIDRGYVVKDDTGIYNHSIITDITTLKKQEEELKLSENRFSVAINASSGTLFEVDLKNKVYTHFENAERIFGVKGEVLLRETGKFSALPYHEFAEAIPAYFFHDEDITLVKGKMKELLTKGIVSFDARLRRYDNSFIWARVDLSIIKDEHQKPSRLVGYMSDIDGIKKQTEWLENKVQIDAMTGLYNRVAMDALCNKAIQNNPLERMALIVLDIDDFKSINDNYGHAFGDVVLIEVCAKLKKTFRSDDILGRMGGDEFAILMRNIADISGVLKKVSELSNELRQTYLGDKKDHKITSSMGIVIIENRDKDTFDSYYRKGDAALYQSKQSGKDQFVLYQDKDAKQYPIKSDLTKDEERSNLKSTYNLEEHIFDLLYASNNFAVSIHMALAAIGQYFHVSRVAIFECYEEHRSLRNIFEWCNDGVVSVIDQLQNVSIHSGEESIMNSFDENGLLYCNNVNDLSPYIRDLMKAQGIMSTLQVTIVNDEKTYGMIGFGACDEYRVWTSEEISKLSYLAKILSVFLFKKEAEATLIENLHTRLKILDILPDYICVVNPEYHTIEYTNKKMQELLPSAKPGEYCFTTLRGGQCGPCETCLLEKIKKGKTDNLEIVSEDKQVVLKVKALTIRWTNSQPMVLLYGTSDHIKKSTF
ncbi:MAG: diguanylate cyclase [Erysipelotrichaceae bacterium]